MHVEILGFSIIGILLNSLYVVLINYYNQEILGLEFRLTRILILKIFLKSILLLRNHNPTYILTSLEMVILERCEAFEPPLCGAMVLNFAYFHKWT